MTTYILIDDEEIIRRGTKKKLEPLSDTIECIGEADNGQAGIDLIREKKPDFVILDMQMPVMDGMELLPYLAEHYPGMPLLVISGYRDFDYIKQAISANAVEYLLKPFSAEMIQNCVRDILQRLSEREQIDYKLRESEEEKEEANTRYDMMLLQNIILGYHVGEPSFTSQKLKSLEGSHELVLLTIQCQLQRAEEEITGWLAENGFADLALYLPAAEGSGMGFLILFLPRIEKTRMQSLLAQAVSAMTNGLGLGDTPITLGVSRRHASVSSLREAYLETVAALDGQSAAYEGSAVYYYEGELSPRQLEWEHTDELLFRIEAGMAEEVTLLTKKLFSFYRTVADCRLVDVKYHCHELSGQCRTILSEYLGETQSAGGVQNIVSHIYSLADLETYYTNFFRNLAELLRPRSVYAEGDIIERVQLYMQRNYRKALTQDFVASLFYINRSYLSTLFKARTGEKFVDYLNDIRIEHAKELLGMSGQKMYQISKNVGYDNVKYFFRVFKKSVGMTPEQYRENCRG